MTDWRTWHDGYESPDSPLARRLEVVRRFLRDALAERPPGAIRVLSMCAGDGRDLLGVLERHDRRADVEGRLVELDPELAERARRTAPPGVEVRCADAGASDSYAGAVPADLLLSCGIFGNVSEADIRRTIEAWSMLCAPGAVVIWTRGGREPDLRASVRGWVNAAGFEELAFVGAPEPFGVGVARMVREPRPFRGGERFFEFLPEKRVG